MKQTITLLIFFGSLALVLSSYSTGPANNGAGNLTGATGASGCSCHGATSSIGTTVQLDSAGVLVTTYHPGVVYHVKIKAVNNTTATNLSHFGFQVSTVTAATGGTSGAVQAGTWGTPPSTTHQTTTGSCSVIEHSDPLAAYSGTGGTGTVYMDSIPWTAPAVGTGAVKIYGVINAVNFDGTSGGDYSQAASAITITEATYTASVSIALTSGSNPSCAGSSVTFTATPANGGTAPSYQWKVGTTNVGTNSPTYTTSTLTTGQVVTCVMTSNLSGVTGSPATSNAISMTITPTVTPSVSISTPSTSICAGASVTFTASPTNGGTNPIYQWKVGTTNVGTNSHIYTTDSLSSGQSVSCVMTSNATCPSPATATSNSLSVTVNPTVATAVTISATDTTVCHSSADTFRAVPTGGGLAPSYQWKIGGTNVGSNSATYITSTLTTGQAVYCIMTSNANCPSPAKDTSGSIAVTVLPTVTPADTITTASTSACPGSSVTFTVLPTNGGTAPSYQWKVGTTNVGTNSPTYSTNTLTNGQVVSCVMTSNATCPLPATSTSNRITMTIGNVVPAITISTRNATVCSGAPDTFTSIATNSGLSPTFEWKVNGTPSGSNSSSFITSTLTTGAVVKCVLLSSSACAVPDSGISNSITVTVNPIVTPTLTITVRHDTICSGLPDTFSATGTHLGTATYQWQVNGTNAGTNSSSFVSSSLANGNTVMCIATSNAACISTSQATSNNISMDVVSAPSISISPSGPMMLCAGDSLRLTASGGSSYRWTNSDTMASIWIYHSGTYDVSGSNGACATTAATAAIVTVDSPLVPSITHRGNVLTSTPAVGYQWTVNDTILTGDTAQTYTIAESGNYVVIISDSIGCHASSIHYFFTYTDTSTVHDTTGISSINNGPDVKLYPIPNQGSFAVEGNGLSDADLNIYDLYGQKIYQQKLSGNYTKVNNPNLLPAIYIVTVSDRGRTKTIKMQVTRE